MLVLTRHYSIFTSKIWTMVLEVTGNPARHFVVTATRSVRDGSGILLLSAKDIAYSLTRLWVGLSAGEGNALKKGIRFLDKTLAWRSLIEMNGFAVLGVSLAFGNECI